MAEFSQANTLVKETLAHMDIKREEMEKMTKEICKSQI